MKLNKPTFRAIALTAKMAMDTEKNVYVKRDDLLVLADLADTACINLQQAVKHLDSLLAQNPSVVSTRLITPGRGLKMAVEAIIARNGYLPPSEARKLATEASNQIAAYEAQVQHLKKRVQELESQLPPKAPQTPPSKHQPPLTSEALFGMEVKTCEGEGCMGAASCSNKAGVCPGEKEASEPPLGMREVNPFEDPRSFMSKKEYKKYKKSLKENKELNAILQSRFAQNGLPDQGNHSVRVYGEERN